MMELPPPDKEDLATAVEMGDSELAAAAAAAAEAAEKEAEVEAPLQAVHFDGAAPPTAVFAPSAPATPNTRLPSSSVAVSRGDRMKEQAKDSEVRSAGLVGGTEESGETKAPPATSSAGEVKAEAAGADDVGEADGADRAAAAAVGGGDGLDTKKVDDAEGVPEGGEEGGEDSGAVDGGDADEAAADSGSPVPVPKSIGDADVASRATHF